MAAIPASETIEARVLEFFNAVETAELITYRIKDDPNFSSTTAEGACGFSFWPVIFRDTEAMFKNVTD